MSRIMCSFALTAIYASTVLASTQVSSLQTEISNPSSTSPVAYVYVSSSPGNRKYQIKAYSASSNGKLSVIPGSPFSAKGAYYMAVNGKWMFGSRGLDSLLAEHRVQRFVKAGFGSQHE